MKYLLLLASMLVVTTLHADTINHIDALATVGQQSFHGGFDWDIQTQSAISWFMDSTAGVFSSFGTVSDNFASWYGPGAFQIDMRQFVPFNLHNFDTLATLDASSGNGALEFYGQLQGLAGGAFGAWNGLTGTLTITDPPDTPVSTPEPSTWAMMLGGLGLLAMLYKLKGDTNGRTI